MSGVNRWRYAWQMRGLEELVEALTLVRYLSAQTLLTPEEANAALPEGLTLTPHDYLNGVMDLFGEMMRFATVLATRDGELVGGSGRKHGQDEEESVQGSRAEDRKRTILHDMHVLSSSVEMLPYISSSSWDSKVSAMRVSVAKVEKLGYGIAIRGGERPNGWTPEEEDNPQHN